MKNLAVLTFGSLMFILQSCSGQKVNNNPRTLTNGKIAFVSDRDGNTEIYTINPDGTQLTRLTNNPAEDTSPFWSPDGSLIGFISNRENGSEIYTMKPDGSDVKKLTDLSGEATVGASWSPDGKQIAFTLENETKLNINLINADGSNLQSIAEGMAPQWHPEGKQIIFNYGQIPAIVTMNTDRSNINPFFQDDSTFRVDLLPVWSSDGNRVLYTHVGINESDKSMNYDIYIIDKTRKNLTRLTEFSGRDLSGNWSPENKQIVFESERDGNPEIYIINTDGTHISRLTENPGKDVQPSWSPKLSGK